jgi:glycosyltransferase involved in cell wall biosynthesis
MKTLKKQIPRNKRPSPSPLFAEPTAMHLLFIHQNFPAQIRCVAPWLASDAGWRCTAVSHNAKRPPMPGVSRLLYPVRADAVANSPPLGRMFQGALGHAQGVHEALKRRKDIQPDLIVAHSGFGSSLFLPQLYDAPIVNFFEYFFRTTKECVGYRPESDVSEFKLLRTPITNAMVLLDLDNCDRGWCPNKAQRSVFPAEYQHKLNVLPEGIDAQLYRRNPAASRRLPDGTEIGSDTRVVTYVARGLEMTRGFDLFMKAAKLVSQRLSNVMFIVIGEDKAYYGADYELTDGRTLREHVLASDDYDLSRIHFTGRVPEKSLADILSISDLHIYLTVPFVTSWSMLDAMACSCVVLASDQACTREYIRHGENGLLCDFFDVEGMADQAVKALHDPVAFRPLGDAARRTIEEHYSLDVCLPRIKSFFERVAANKRTPSVRAELLVRQGTGLPPIRIVEEPEAAEERPAFEGGFPFHANGKAASDLRGASTSRDREGADKPLADARGSFKEQPRTILFAWELGGGLGHLLPMRPLVEELAGRGRWTPRGRRRRCRPSESPRRSTLNGSWRRF